MSKKTVQKNKGFSLVEFVVILTIFAIMTSVSLFNYNQHQSTLGQSALAQDVALTIRQAQVYGISATDTLFGIAADNFDETSHFNTLAGVGGGANIINDKSIRGVSINLSENKLTIFEDSLRSGHMNVFDSSDRIIDEREVLSSRVGFEYISLCSGSGTCTEVSEGSLDITFQRPYPDAYIRYRSGPGPSSTPYVTADIVVSEGEDAEKNSYVEVLSIGGITVKNNHES